MKRLIWALIGACLVSASLAAVDGPRTPFVNLRGRTDANGYLLVVGGAYTAADGPLTNLANLRVRTDANGYLIVALTGGSFTGQLLAPTGCTTVPYSFTVQPGLGFCRGAANEAWFMSDAFSSTNPVLAFTGGSGGGAIFLNSNAGLLWSSTASASGSGDLRFRRTATKTLTVDDGAGGAAALAVTGDLQATTNVQAGASSSIRWNSSTRLLAPANGKFAVIDSANGHAYTVQAQGTPSCTSNCGTSPSVSGNDSSFTVTMGSTGSPASGWVVTFNATWDAAPQCDVVPALAGMVAGKLPIVVATTTTNVTVTTNGTAPANSDKYHVHCTSGT